MFKRKKKFQIPVSAYEYRMILDALMSSREKLMAQGRYTDAVDDAGVCLEGAIIVLACIIYSKFATSVPSVDATASAITQVWTYVGELLFNMLVLVGTIKLSDQVVQKMIGV